jgi:hypothetical protein
MSKTCFVVSVIGDEGSEARKYADTLFDYIIAPVAKGAGYNTVERGDHDYQPGMIPHQIITKILTYDLVIADLTEPNPNVYYELAIRHCSGKRYIQMMKQGLNLPFDVAQVRCVHFGLQVNEAEAGKAALLKQIQAAEQDKEPVFNPVTQTQAMVKVEKTGDTTQRMLVSLLESQSATADAVLEMQKALVQLQRRAAFPSWAFFPAPTDPGAGWAAPTEMPSDSGRSLGLLAGFPRNALLGDTGGGDT